MFSAFALIFGLAAFAFDTCYGMDCSALIEVHALFKSKTISSEVFTSCPVLNRDKAYCCITLDQIECCELPSFLLTGLVIIIVVAVILSLLLTLLCCLLRPLGCRN